nr:hypothetical protein [Eubacterium sp.]
ANDVRIMMSLRMQTKNRVAYCDIKRILVELARKISLCMSANPVRVLTEKLSGFYIFRACHSERRSHYDELAKQAKNTHDVSLLAHAIANAVRIMMSLRMQTKNRVAYCDIKRILVELSRKG